MSIPYTQVPQALRGAGAELNNKIAVPAQWREGSIAHMLDQIDTVSMNIHSNLSILEKRLTPLMQPPYDEPGSAPCPPPTCAFAATLQGKIDVLNTINELITNINNRLYLE